MVTVSLCMIVKNEEAVLSRCLNSISHLVDEIIIIDTGSTDRTKEIARHYTHSVFDFPWIDDFSAARNFSYARATMDYILWLDADDILLADDQVKFRALKESLAPSVDVVMMKYNAGFDDKGNVVLSYYRERLSKRSKGFRWHEPVHEYLETSGNIINSDISITHKKENLSTGSGDRNLAIYEQHLSKGAYFSPRGLYYYAKELYYNERYKEAIYYFNKFLDTEKGWVEDKIAASFDLSICYGAVSDEKSMIKTLLRTFEYDTPRAEICCQLGEYYFQRKDYKSAIVWYKIATQLEKPLDSWGFVFHDYWGYLPNVQISLCYYELGQFQEALYYNNLAGGTKPQDSTVTHNRDFFTNLISKSKLDE